MYDSLRKNIHIIEMDAKNRIIIYLVSLLGIGIALAGKASGSEDFTVLWKRAPGILVLFLLTGLGAIYVAATTNACVQMN